MSELEVCDLCRGFRPSTLSRCPHCDATTVGGTHAAGPRRLERLCRAGVQAATGGVLAMTLMACYGSPHSMPEPMSPEGVGCSEEEAAGDANGECSESEEPGDPMTMAGDGEADSSDDDPKEVPEDGEAGSSMKGPEGEPAPDGAAEP